MCAGHAQFQLISITVLQKGVVWRLATMVCWNYRASIADRGTRYILESNISRLEHSGVPRIRWWDTVECQPLGLSAVAVNCEIWEQQNMNKF